MSRCSRTAEASSRCTSPPGSLRRAPQRAAPSKSSRRPGKAGTVSECWTARAPAASSASSGWSQHARGAAGNDLESVADLVRQARTEARQWILLDTLEYLKRGGRIGSAAAWIGSTLKIKPVITVESEIKAVERVRTRERGLDRLVDYGRQLHAAGANGWWVQHTRAPEDAATLVERLKEIFWRPPEFVSEVGPVLGTHTGPGLLGIGAIPLRFLE